MWFSGRESLYTPIATTLDKAMWGQVKWMLFPNCLQPAIWKQKANLFAESQKSNGQLLIYKPAPGGTAPFARVRNLISSRRATAFITKSRLKHRKKKASYLVNPMIIPLLVTLSETLPRR